MPWFGKYWTRRELWREVDRLRAELALARQGGAAGFAGASVTRFPGRSELALRLGPDDRIHQVSHSLAEALGRASHELAGQPLAEVDRFEWGAGYLADLARRAREVGDTLHEWRDFFQDGRDRAYALRATPLEGGGVSLIMQDLSEHRRLERAFGRMVSPAVLERLRADGQDALRPERLVLSVMFCDLRSFTPLAERVSPEQVVALLNDFLSGATQVLMGTFDGTVDKFLGDGLLCFFGHPTRMADHAVRAVRAALAIQERHARLQADYRARGLEVPALGVGVNTGDVVVGEIGSPQRTEYTVIGGAVNAAARLCGLARAGEVLVGQTTRSTMAGADQGLLWTERQVDLKGIGRVTAFQVAKGR